MLYYTCLMRFLNVKFLYFLSFCLSESKCELRMEREKERTNLFSWHKIRYFWIVRAIPKERKKINVAKHLLYFTKIWASQLGCDPFNLVWVQSLSFSYLAKQPYFWPCYFSIYELIEHFFLFFHSFLVPLKECVNDLLFWHSNWRVLASFRKKKLKSRSILICSDVTVLSYWHWNHQTKSRDNNDLSR